ncbi:MAG: carboxypeptidase regulatory-like domain-containing protein, partial [Bacteroidia bacterium]|nr:carboxypeptidase regulatory-like domain-containing protein [Bacteroidia bacterium]
SQGGKVKNFPKPIKLNEPINSDYSELEGCITTDGTMMIFASDRPGSIGQMDLYMSRKLPNGAWGTATNLGENINSKQNEGFPVFDEINNILYFASEGHFNMGGYDIFKSKYNVKTQKFEPAINIGYPINTPEDNMQFSLAGNGRDGYISSYRKEGYGDLDIYKVIFNDVEIPITVLKGNVSYNDSTAKEINATIKIIDSKSKQEIDFRTINSKTGRFVFALEPGKYTLEIDSPGYISQKIDVPILDMADFVSEKEKNILLLKEGTQHSVPDPKKNAMPINKTVVPQKK